MIIFKIVIYYYNYTHCQIKTFYGQYNWNNLGCLAISNFIL